MEGLRTIDSQSCKEVYVIFNKLGLYYKLPEEIKKYIFDNQNPKYKYDINIEIPLIDQIKSERTKAYISYLYLKYINNNEEEKEMLLRKYKQNEKIYQEKLQEHYNTDEVFKRKFNNNENIKTENQGKQVAVYKNSIIQKIVSFFKKIINK